MTEEITTEDFDIVERLSTYNNFKEQRNNKAYKLLAENKVDNYEFLDIDKEPLAGSYPIKDKDSKVQEAKEKDFLEGMFELGENLKNSDVIKSIKSRVPEGFINVADFGTNIFNAFDKFFSLDPTYKRSEIFNKWSDNLGKIRNQLKEKREGVEGWSDMAGMVLQDAPVMAALYPIFSKFMSKPKAAALSFGVGYAMSFDEENPSMFMDSETISKLNHLIKVLPDTPEDQIADDVIEMIEGTGMAGLTAGVIKGFKFIKNNLSKETVSDVAKIAAGGTVAVATIAGTEAKGEEISQIPEPININEKPTIDVSEPKFMEMGMSPKAGVELGKLAIEGGKRIIAGISRQKKKIPTTLEQNELAIPLIKTFDDDAKVLTYKVDDSVGKFSETLERNLDVEALVKNDFDTNKIINTVVNQAKKFDQESVFVSEQVVKRNRQSNVAFSVQFSTPKLFGDAEAVARELEKMTGLQGYTFRTKVLNLGDLPIANPNFTPKKRIYHNAIKNNGTTTDIREAGFIGPDGKMIDGGQGSGVRITEHRDMAALAYKTSEVLYKDTLLGLGIESKENFTLMYKFMEDTGSIRVSMNGAQYYAEIYQKPTLTQLKKIVETYNKGNFEYIVIDAINPTRGRLSAAIIEMADVQNVFRSDTRINVAELEKFFDIQAIRGKRFISIQSMNIPEYSKISDDAFVEKLFKIESNLSNTFGTKDISKPNLEYYINNVINKADYGKYK